MDSKDRISGRQADKAEPSPRVFCLSCPLPTNHCPPGSVGTEVELGGALAAEGLGDVIHLRTVHLGPDDILVTAKIGQEPGVTVAQHAAQADRAEAAIRAAVPAVRLIFLEPDVRRADAGAQLDD